MIYLYLFVTIIGLVATPIVAGFLYERKVRRIQYGFVDSDDYIWNALGAGIMIIFWPIAIPIAAVVGLFWALAKLPKFLLDYLENRREKSAR